MREQLLSEATLRSNELIAPTLADPRDICLVHTREYWEGLSQGTLSADAIRRLGFPWSESLVRRSRASVQGTLTAARIAIREGIGVNLAGGTHHAFAVRGEGYCVLNDIAIAIRVLQRDRWMQRLAIIDCDVHQGNGTAAIFAEEPDVFMFSIHGANNYPLHKVAGSLDIELPDGTADRDYLAKLEPAVSRILSEFQPGLVFYLAGGDAHADDPFGRLQQGDVPAHGVVGDVAAEVDLTRDLTIERDGQRVETRDAAEREAGGLEIHREPAGLSAMAALFATGGEVDSAAFYYGEVIRVTEGGDSTWQRLRREAMFNRGAVYNQAKRWTESEFAFREFLAVYPGDVQALAGLATAFAQTGRQDSALATYRMLLAHSDEAEPRHMLAAGVAMFNAAPPDPDSGAIVDRADTRWTAAKKALIRDSRARGTQQLVRAVRQHGPGVPTLVQGSAIGYYGERGDERLTASSTKGAGFLADVVQALEAELRPLTEQRPQVRVPVVRTGIVLARQGGALAEMLPMFRLSAAGRLGTGRQWMSWIHLDDIVGLFLHALDAAPSGLLEGVAPQPATNQQFTTALCRTLGVIENMPAPSLAIQALFGDRAAIVLGSTRLEPMTTRAAGFRFRFEAIEQALDDLLAPACSAQSDQRDLLREPRATADPAARGWRGAAPRRHRARQGVPGRCDVG